jgi:glutamyl/glutaminyl-tRNA synthetase
VTDALIELIAADKPYPGTISARRESEPSFEFLNGVSDAIMAALARGVDLVVPRESFDQIWVELPAELPKYVNIR